VKTSLSAPHVDPFTTYLAHSPAARIAIPAPEHACRYDHKSPAALAALRLMLHLDRFHTRNAPNARPGMRQQARAARTM
jgi:hypothetical protein